MSDISAQEAQPSESKPVRGSLPMLVVMYCSAFMAAFNENLMNVALISIMDEFNVTEVTVQWLVTGYMIITAIVITITAFISRRFKLRILHFTALLLIVIGSLVCMFSPNFPVLLVARLGQAVGTGLCIPLMMNTVLVVSPPRKLGTYLSIGGCMITFGPALAPVVSGLMVTMIGWRAVFAPPMVCAAILIILGLFLVRNVMKSERIHLDLLSVVLIATGLFLFVYGLSIITTDVPVAVAMIVAGLAIIAVFAFRQFRITDPLLDLKPLLNRLFSPVCLLMIVGMMTSFSMSVLIPLYCEGSLGMTSLMAGVMLLVPVLANALTSVLGGRIMDKRGCWPLLPCGFGCIVVGQVMICLTATQMSWMLTLIGSIIVYASIGFIFSPTQAAGLQTLPPDQNPHGVALINVSIQVSASIGPSLFVGILSSTAASSLAGGATEELSQAAGFSSAVLVSSIIALAGFIIAIVYSHVRHARRKRGIISYEDEFGAEAAQGGEN